MTGPSVAAEDFDLRALYAALDERRQARGLTWAAAAREINGVGPVGARRPVATSTMTSLSTKALAEADGVLQMLRWLRAREARGLTWSEMAAETGVPASHMRGLASGGRTAFPFVMRLTRWLHEPASRFVRRSPN